MYAATCAITEQDQHPGLEPDVLADRIEQCIVGLYGQATD